MLQYILECIAFQLVFLIIYDLFLKRETFFQWNRFYLIGTYIISMVLPWIKIEAMKTTVPESFQAYPEFLWNTGDVGVTATAITIEETSFTISWEYALLFGGMFLATLFFGYKLDQIYTLKRKGHVRYFKDYTRIIVSNSAIAFSFFKSIFLGDKVVEKEHESIVQHELVHIRQRHSYDLMFFELMRIVGWFNPLVYVYQSRVSELHEFIADAQVAKTDKKEQYEFLLSQIFQTQNISFINQFFKSSLIKKRIVMLTKEKSKQVLKLKYLLLLPLVFGMLAYTSSEAQDKPYVSQSDDEILLAEAKERIEKEIDKLGSLIEVNFKYANRSHFADSDGPIVSKEEYFESALLFRMTMHQIDKDIAQEKNTQTQDYLSRVPLPSTARYENYVKRKEAFQIIDENLKFSIKSESKNIGYDIRKIEKGETYTGSSYELEVIDVRDLTGKEIILFNNKMDEIFGDEGAINSSLILKDNQYRFQIFAAKPVIGINTYPKHSNSNNDADNIKKEEYEKDIPFALVDEVPVFPGCEGAEDKRKCFLEAMNLHISKNFRYPKEAQDNGIQGQVNTIFIISKKGKIESLRMRGPDSLLEREVKRIIKKLPKMKPGKHKGKRIDVAFSIPVTFKLNHNGDDLFKKYLSKENQFNPYATNMAEKYNHLVEERKRLLKSRNEKNPIIVSLDQHLNQLRQTISDSLSGSVDGLDQKINSYKDVHTSPGQIISQYNQLVAERKRLLRSSNEKNPIIVNLDQQIKALKRAIDQENETVPFATVDKVPVFPGCEDVENKRKCFNEKMQKHISKNFNYPQEAQDKGIQGRVAVMFTIATDGSIQNIRKRGPDSLLENEVERIIKRLPKMKSGKQKGKAVNVPFSIPVTFKLSETNTSESSLEFSKFLDKTTLLVIDGEEYMGKLNFVDKDNIENYTILEDEVAIKKYGQKGKNGVVEITTKKKN